MEDAKELNAYLKDRAESELNTDIIKLFVDIYKEFGKRIHDIVGSIDYTGTASGCSTWQILWHMMESRSSSYDAGNLFWNTHTASRPSEVDTRKEVDSWVAHRQKKLMKELLERATEDKETVTVRGRVVEE
jgi:nitric oxide synthase oxygenase domain/subunit